MAQEKKTSNSLNLTESEIIKAIEDSYKLDRDNLVGMTTLDISLKSGYSIKTVRKWIREMKRRGVQFEEAEVIRYTIWDKPYKTMAIVGISWDKDESISNTTN